MRKSNKVISILIFCAVILSVLAVGCNKQKSDKPRIALMPEVQIAAGL